MPHPPYVMQPTVSVLSHLRLNISIIQVQAFGMHRSFGVKLLLYSIPLSGSRISWIKKLFLKFCKSMYNRLRKREKEKEREQTFLEKIAAKLLSWCLPFVMNGNFLPCRNSELWTIKSVIGGKPFRFPSPSIILYFLLMQFGVCWGRF